MSILKSRKFWIFTATVATALCNQVFELKISDEAIWGICVVAASLIGGIALEDYAVKNSGEKK